MISRDVFNTGDNVLSPVIEVTMQVPDNPWVWRALRGALLLLCDENNWNEDGTATKELAETTFIDIYDSLDFVP